MDAIRVFIDTSVFIDWLRKKERYLKNIESIRDSINNNQLQGVISLDVLLELHRGEWGAQEIDLIKEKWKYEITYLTPNFIVGVGSGVEQYKLELDKFASEWKKLSEVTKNDPDSKHYVTARYSRCLCFLTTETKFINKMKNQGKKFFKDTEILNPDNFLKKYTYS